MGFFISFPGFLFSKVFLENYMIYIVIVEIHVILVYIIRVILEVTIFFPPIISLIHLCKIYIYFLIHTFVHFLHYLHFKDYLFFPHQILHFQNSI